MVEAWAKKPEVGLDIEREAAAGVGLWGDGGAYNTRDQIMLLLFNVVTGLHFTQRYLIGVLSKLNTCRCGCKGQCTLNSFLRVVKIECSSDVGSPWTKDVKLWQLVGLN